MTLESTCIPIPSEAVVPYAGYLASEHAFPLWAVVVAATAANVVGGLIAYAVGRAGGRALIVKWGRYVLLNRRHLDRAEQWFSRYGQITVFVGRLLPALRTFISLPAGVARMPVGRFMLYSALGSLPWNLALALAGFVLGQHWETVSSAVKPLTYAGALLLVAAVLWFWFGRRRPGAAHGADVRPKLRD
ncbi:MAG: DedA family protein [Alicyclobacillaceae bacterium]|nr:DedA family protein [Alicyclobacillaceae bacterium]